MLTSGHTSYSYLLRKVYVWFGKYSCTEAELEVLHREATHFKIIVVSTFAKHCRARLLSLMFQPLDYIIGDLCRFGMLTVLDPSPFENSNRPIRTSYRRTSRCIIRRMDKIVESVLLLGKLGEMGCKFTQRIHGATR